MQHDAGHLRVPWLSLPLAVLIIIVSLCGLLVPETYSEETINWQAQAVGEDAINLFFITPCLIIASWFAYKGHREGILIWDGVFFYLLWLSTVIPAMINNVATQEVNAIGTPTNPVHALDLSIVLPTLILTAILLWRKRKMGFILAPIILTFCILMGVTIGALEVF